MSNFQRPHMESMADKILKQERLVDWIVEILQESIVQIVARRKLNSNKSGSFIAFHEQQQLDTIPLDEIVQAIQLPAFDAASASIEVGQVEIPNHIVESLRSYVSIVSIRTSWGNHKNV